MGEVLNDRDAVDLVAHFQPALDAFKAGQRFDDRIFADTLTGSQRRGGCGVQGVVFAGHVHRELGPRAPPRQTSQRVSAVYVAEIADAPVGGIAKIRSARRGRRRGRRIRSRCRCHRRRR